MLVEDGVVLGKPQALGVMPFGWIHSVFPGFCLHDLQRLPAPSPTFLLSWRLLEEEGLGWGRGAPQP